MWTLSQEYKGGLTENRPMYLLLQSKKEKNHIKTHLNKNRKVLNTI